MHLPPVYELPQGVKPSILLGFPAQHYNICCASFNAATDAVHTIGFKADGLLGPFFFAATFSLLY